MGAGQAVHLLPDLDAERAGLELIEREVFALVVDFGLLFGRGLQGAYRALADRHSAWRGGLEYQLGKARQR